MREMVARSEWPKGRDVTLQLRSPRGCLVTVTVHASSTPIDKDETIRMAAEAISQLASEQSPAVPTGRADLRISHLDGGELFRSWALPSHY
jgi:hypothetical protein